MNELKNRGVEDIMLAVVDGLKGLEVADLTDSRFGEKSPARLVQRNGYRDWRACAGTVELRIPKLRKGRRGGSGDGGAAGSAAAVRSGLYSRRCAT